MKLIAAACIAFFAFPLAAAVRIVGDPLLAVTGDTNSATGIIHLKNDDPKNAAPLFLELGDFTGAEQRGLGTSRKIGPVNETPAKTYLEGSIPANGELRIAVEVANLLEPGYSSAVLLNKNAPIGTVRALKERFAFNVAPVGWKGDAPLPLATNSRGVMTLVLKNSDPVTYSVAWKLADAGRLHDGNVLLHGNEETRIPVTESRDGDRWWNTVDALFHNRQTDAILTLTALPRPAVRTVSPLPGQNDTPAMAFTSRTFPMRITHVVFSPAAQTLASSLTALLVLFLGTLASLYLTYSLPNRVKRLKGREAIEASASTALHLSSSIPSSLRTSLRVECKRLLARLHSRLLVSPEFTAIATACENGATLLARQAEMLARSDRTYHRIEDLWHSSHAFGPTTLRRASELLSEAQLTVDKPQVSDAELQAAEAKVADAAALVAGTRTLDDAFRTELAAGVKYCLELKAKLSDTTSLDKFLAEVPELNAAVDTDLQDVQKIDGSNYHRVNFAVTKIGLLLKFLIARQAVSEPAARKEVDELLQKMLQALRMHSFADFLRAEQYEDQLREAIFSGEVRKAIAASELRIDWEPQRPKTNEAVEYRMTFDNGRFNSAAARECFTCRWDFGDGWRPEEGWKVSHYFGVAGAPTVTATFFDETGTPVVDEANMVTIQQAITVEKEEKRFFGERSRIEIVQIAIILIVASFALLAGAADQLSKLDLVPAIIAIFILGFSADRVKTALAART